MPSIRVTLQAEEDILVVLSHALQEWGPTKYWEYRHLIEETYGDILADPSCGRVNVPARPGVQGRHIRKPGRRARHIVFYKARNNGDIEVVRFLHDAMDFERHLSK